MFKYRHLFFLPSFYLLLTFSASYLLYVSDIIYWEHPPFEIHFWSIAVILMALLSIKYNAAACNEIINDHSFQEKKKQAFLNTKFSWIIFFLFTAIGILGIIKYIFDYSRLLGAFSILYSFFLEDTGKLRTYAENVESVGTQLSYFSWFSAFIVTAQIACGKFSRKWFIFIVFIILLNTLFLDRTRPVWLMFVCTLIYFFITYEEHTRKKIIYILSSIAGFFISLFLLIGSILGKDSGVVDYTRISLPGPLQLVVVYLTSSFAYMGRLFKMDMPCDYYPARITYPLQKLLAKFHWVDQPPNQVLEFFSVPHLTNVGGFMEPFYQDGGSLFLAFAIVLYTFIFDRLVIKIMKNISAMGIIMIATICFISFMAFFVPKIASTATWFTIIAAFLLSYLMPSTTKEKMPVQ